MKKLNLFLAAILSAALTGIGAAPASATDNSILPSDANGVDNSGIYATMCPNELQIALPAKPSADPNDAIVTGEYPSYKWRIQLDDYWATETDSTSSSRVTQVGIQAFNQLGPHTYSPEETVTVTLTAIAWDSGFNEIESDPFQIEVEVVDPYDFATGSGTSADPYIISNAADLERMRCGAGKHYELANDIDMANEPFIPMGAGLAESGGDFEGTWYANWTYSGDAFAQVSLNGNGHTISNLYIPFVGDYSGLFGRIRYSAVKNLNLDNAEVWGNNTVGVLFGYSTETFVRNVNITNSEIHTYGSRGGLLVGTNDYNSTFRDISTQGTSYGHVWGNAFTGNTGDGISGYVGYDDADGSIHENISVDVDVIIDTNDDVSLAEHSNVYKAGGMFSEIGEGASVRNATVDANITIDSLSYVNDVGCFSGDSEELYFVNIDVNCTIDITAGGTVRDISGVIGQTDSAHVANVDAVSAINIDTAGSVYHISGFISEPYDSSAINATIHSDITVNQSGNSYEIRDIGIGVGSNDEGNFEKIRASGSITLTESSSRSGNTVLRIGGFAGENEMNANYADIESDVEINIGQFSGEVRNIGGFIGGSEYYRNAPMSDIVVKGSINVDSQADSIGGLIGYSGGINADRILVAVEINEAAGSTNVGPVTGSFYDNAEESEWSEEKYPLARSRWANLYWDSTVETTANQADFPGESATTTQLQDATWLNEAGFVLGSEWSVSASYPVLQDVYTRSAAVDFSKFGQANKNLKIAFTKMRATTARTYIINLVKKYSGKKVRIQFLRAGAVYKTLKKGKLDINGDKRFASKVAIATSDVIRVKVGKKTVARYVVK